MNGKVFGNLTVIGINPEFPKGTLHKYWKVRCSCGRESLIYESSLMSGSSTTCGNCSGIKDIKVGDKFDKLTIVGEKKKFGKRWKYPVKCDCGNPEIKWVRNDYLTAKGIKEKGCGNCTKFDIIGKKFGRWTVVSYNCSDKKQQDYLCKCSCGTERILKRSTLIQGKSNSCGCFSAEQTSKRMSNNLVGQKFGKLTVVARNGSDKSGNAIFTCLCECGKTKDILGLSLKKKNKPTRSCGCLVHYDKKSAETVMLNSDKKHIGVKRGKLTPIKRAIMPSGRPGYLCKCDCKKEVIISRDSILSGQVTSCGCEYTEKHIEKLKKEYIGKKYNRLTIKDLYMNQEGESRAIAVCECECNKKIEIPFIKVRSGHTKSCGCLFEDQRGENHPRWNPELTDEERSANESRTSDPRYKRWRKKVLKKNEEKCAKCGNTVDLHVHHIKPWSVFEESRFDEENGAILCEICHNLYHSTYGETEQAEDDYKEFLAL